MIESFRELADGAREVRLQVKQGDLKVAVVAGAEPYLRWDAHGDAAPEVSRDGDTLRIRQVESWFDRRMDVELQLAASPEVLVAKSGSGEVELSGVVGAVRAESGNGQVVIADVRGELHATTGNGRVAVRAAEGRLRVNTGNGRLELKDVVGAVEATTGNGQVELELAGSSELRVSSGNGDIRVRGGSVLRARLNTGKGDLECSSVLEPGHHTFSTGKGDISALLPPDARARVDLQTGHGDVVSDFALVRVGRTGPMGFGGTRMVGSIGDGEPEIEVSAKTGKGDLRLISADGPSAGRARVSVGFEDRRAWKEQRQAWREARRGWGGLGVDIASTISAEVASAIASGLAGREPPIPPEPPPAPRVEVVVHPRDAGSTSAAAGSTGSASERPAAPAPPPPDMSGAVRSSQTPTGPEPADPTLAVLQAVARGEISPEEAELLLGRRQRGGAA